jgi:hypothetical protein
MAQRITNVSDLNGEDTQGAPPVTVTLTYGEITKAVEIDLTAAETETLDKLLSDYFTHGREPSKPATRKIAPTAADVERKVAVRKWAQTNPGFTWNGETVGEVKDGGRLSEKVYRLYDAYAKNAAQVDAEAEAKATLNGNGDAKVTEDAPIKVAAPAKSRK